MAKTNSNKQLIKQKRILLEVDFCIVVGSSQRLNHDGDWKKITLIESEEKNATQVFEAGYHINFF